MFHQWIIIWKTYLVIVKIKQIHKFFIVKLNWADKKICVMSKNKAILCINFIHLLNTMCKY